MTAQQGTRDGPALARRWLEPDPTGGNRGEAMLRQLADSRDAPRQSAGDPLDLRGLQLIDADLSGLDLRGCDFSGGDLSRADLRGANLFGARFVGAAMCAARIGGAELTGADLTRADLSKAEAERVGLGRATLTEACLFQVQLAGATLTEADLRKADLRLAGLRGARARGMQLEGADLSKADLREAELDDSRVERAVFDGADLRGSSLKSLAGYERARWMGVDVRDIDFTGAYRCRRHILDENYLEEFRTQSALTRHLHTVWWLTSDCGRSLVRWALWIGVLALAFAGLYSFVGIDYGDYETWLSPLYYSVVTLTTLGYGDVLPSTVGGQVVAMIEVTLGYVMLGGLLSIFSNKMARRAE